MQTGTMMSGIIPIRFTQPKPFFFDFINRGSFLTLNPENIVSFTTLLAAHVAC